MNLNKVAIYEPHADGHRLLYVRYIASELMVRQGQVVTVFTSLEAASSEMWRSSLGPLEGLKVVIVESLQAALAIAKRTGLRRLVIPDGDIHLKTLVALNRSSTPVEVSLLLMRSQFEWGLSYWRTNMIVFLKLLIASYLRLTFGFSINRLAPVGVRYLFFKTAHDPVSVQELGALRRPEILNEFSDTSIVGVLGAIDSRKNVDLVADAICSFPNGASLLVAGRINPNYKDRCNSSKHRLDKVGRQMILLDKVLSEHELDSLVANLDCVVVAQSNNASSGIVLKCLALGTPVVCAGSPVLKRIAKRYPGNVLAVAFDSQSISRGILQVLTKFTSKPQAMPAVEDFVKALVQ